MGRDNMSLGRFRLEGIAAAPRGVPQIEVTFDIDANGILNVTAQDKATGKEQNITITASTNLSQSEIDDMVRQAEEQRAADMEKKERVEIRNRADQIAYQVDKQLSELGDQIPVETKAELENKVQQVRNAVKANDDEQIRSSLEALEQAAIAMGQAVYDTNAADMGQTEQNTSQRDDDEEIVEGEFRQA